jgi:branched-chain amino acid:cation transporter, LIVCS family
MKKIMQSQITIIGLAIFSMLFGAGNIIYPIKAGVLAGSKNYAGILGFLLTGVCLPIIGLIAMILFDGNYKKFFSRIGKVPGNIAILYCLLIIGPLLAMPRCITVPHAMITPFIPYLSPGLFSVLFCLATFLLTYKESKLLNILGTYISPLLVGSLSIILIKGLAQAESMIEQTEATFSIFTQQLIHGFQTLDLLGAMFFAYIVLKILKDTNKDKSTKPKDLATIALKSGLVGGALLMGIYLGFSYLAAYYGHLVTPDMNGAEMFTHISSNVISSYGAIIIILAVLMACLSTISALAVVFAEYLHYEIFNKKVKYLHCLLITLGVTCLISNFGLSNILKYGEHPINIGYPIIITIVLFNLLHKLFKVETIKLPVFITTITVTGLYSYLYLLS